MARPEVIYSVLGAALGCAITAAVLGFRERASFREQELDSLLFDPLHEKRGAGAPAAPRGMTTPPRLGRAASLPDSAYPTGGATVNTRRLSVDDGAPSPPQQQPPLAVGVVAPIIVGVAGGSGSGKTCIATLISDSLQGVRVVSISSDSYYKGLAPGALASENNWDHPAALDLDLLGRHLRDLRGGRSIRVPEYSFVEHARMPDAAAHFVSAAETDVVIVDGIFVLHDEAVRAACDLTLFTVEDLDVCLARRLRRDIAERGRTIESVLIQYLRFVRPGCACIARPLSYPRLVKGSNPAPHPPPPPPSVDVNFVAPSMNFADILVPRARDNVTAINMVAKEVARRVAEAKARAGAPAAGARPALCAVAEDSATGRASAT